MVRTLIMEQAVVIGGPVDWATGLTLQVNWVSCESEDSLSKLCGKNITICPSGSRLPLRKGKTAAREASTGGQPLHSNEDLQRKTVGRRGEGDSRGERRERVALYPLQAWNLRNSEFFYCHYVVCYNSSTTTKYIFWPLLSSNVNFRQVSTFTRLRFLRCRQKTNSTCVSCIYSVLQWTPFGPQ